MIKAQFNIYGLRLEISSDDPSLLECFEEDLRTFRITKGKAAADVRLALESLLPLQNDKQDSSFFGPYREFGSQRFSAGGILTRFGRASILVAHHFKRRFIRAAVAKDESIFPDPAYHYCFTQPVNLWLKRRGFFPLHAGCVAKGNRGILIIGAPHAGKSVLSVSAVRSGFKFLSDEQPLLSLNGRLRVHAFPRRIRLDASVASLFPELGRFLNSSSGRIIFPIEKIWPGCLLSECFPRVLIFPKFRLKGKMRLAPLPKEEALNRLMQDDYFIWYRDSPWSRISHRHFSLFEKLVRKIPSYLLEYGRGDILKISRVFQKLLAP